ncbi:MAG: FtsW/RodA/SpoVE family cell cycle protein, partial [Prevotella sp.]
FVLIMVMAIGHDTHDEEKKIAKTELTDKSKKEPAKKLNAIEKMFHRADTWKTRIMKFTDKKEISPKEYDLDKDGQVAHANIAIVSSNFIGKGPGNSVERDFLPQAFSDFIYAIIIEELGVLGATFVAFLYIILLFRTGRIANRCENYFPALLAMGLALLLVVQATFNMLVAVGFVPVTGQPLPLISKGGTSTILNCAYIGAILSISRSAKKKDKQVDDEYLTPEIAGDARIISE